MERARRGTTFVVTSPRAGQERCAARGAARPSGVGHHRSSRGEGALQRCRPYRRWGLAASLLSLSRFPRPAPAPALGALGGKRSRAGQEIRVLDINADAGKGFGVFDVGDNPENLARELRQAAVNSYGTAGSAFIRAIIARTDDVAIIVKEGLDGFRETGCQRQPVWPSAARSQSHRTCCGRGRACNSARNSPVADRLSE